MTRETINHYLQFVTSKEDHTLRGLTTGRTRYQIGDRFTVDIMRVDSNLNSRNSLMKIWKKAGYIPAVLPSYLVVNTYYTDIHGNCWGWYNVTVKRSEDGKRQVLDFDYLREATPENEAELLAECIRMYEMDIRPHA